MSTPQKAALQHIAKQFADFLAGRHGNPQALDESDIELLNALKDGAADHLDVMTAQEIFRKQEWCGHIPEAVQDVDATAHQIAADVARLEDMQKQSPALLRSSLDSLRESMLKLDSLLEQHVGHFAQGGTAEPGDRIARKTVAMPPLPSSFTAVHKPTGRSVTVLGCHVLFNNKKLYWTHEASGYAEAVQCALHWLYFTPKPGAAA